MKLVLIQSDNLTTPGQQILAHVLRHPLLAAMLELYHRQIKENVAFVFPESCLSSVALKKCIRHYSEKENTVTSWIPADIEQLSWICISHGAYINQVDEAMVETLLSKTEASIVCVNVDEQLAGHREQIRYTCDGSIVGFRRFYEDSAMAVPPLKRWAHRIYIRSTCVKQFES